MEARIPARLTAAEGRKFGLTVGLAFAAFGAIAYWRGKHRTGIVLLGVGGLLVLAALAIPTSLGPVERAWMGLARLISKVTTPIFMAIVYFVAITPIGFIRGRTSGSPIRQRERQASRWEPHVGAAAPRESMEHQY
jgi:hypothetical protein